MTESVKTLADQIIDSLRALGVPEYRLTEIEVAAAVVEERLIGIEQGGGPGSLPEEGIDAMPESKPQLLRIVVKRGTMRFLGIQDETGAWCGTQGKNYQRHNADGSDEIRTHGTIIRD